MGHPSRVPMLETRASPTALATRTLDLAELAGVRQADRVRVQGLPHQTLDLFEKTVQLLESVGRETVADHPTVSFIPQQEDLRARFKLAEILGSYATLNTLLDRYAPAYELTRTMAAAHQIADLTVHEIALLEDYRDQIERALEHASRHISLCVTTAFTDEELHELNEVLTEARNRYQALDTVLGMRLIHDVEHAVQRLADLREKIATVQRTLSGIFLIDTEIMFVPSADLVRIVNDIFKAIGNPFVVEHIDGTLLLAARNLLIQVMSFYAYYGREQIYRVFSSSPGKAGRKAVSDYIRGEIRTLFSVCRASNKLILTRVMDDAEREFEISVEALQIEAANRAIAEVNRLAPPPSPPPPPPPPTLLSRIASWLFRGTDSEIPTDRG
ncbi:MAG: hypothetical protein AB7Q81_02345 [Gammaproteobacteria bacterium]